MKIKNFKLKILVSLAVDILLLSIFIPTVLAQQVSLSISPPLLNVVIKPGRAILVAYKLENSGDPAIFKAKVLPFIPRDNLGNIKIKDSFEGPLRFSLDNADIELDKAFFLKTKDSQQLLLRIRVPDGAPEGDYYYSLMAETQPAPGIEGTTASQARATIASNILITVTGSGNVEIKGKIALFDVLPRFELKILGKKFSFFDTSDKIPLALYVENRGKNLIQPEGEITLVGNFGERAKYEIISQNILAESQRLLTATPSAEVDLKQPVSLVLSGFYLGSYKLSTSVNFGFGSPNYYASASFIALPFKFILGSIVVFIISIFIIKKVKKHEEETL